MSRHWWAPLVGVAFLVVLIASFVVGGEPPDADEPVQEIVDHYSENQDAVRIGAVLEGAAGVLLIFFGAVLRRALVAGDRDSSLPNVAFAGTVVLAVGAAIDGTISFSLAESAEDIDPAGVQALQALWDNDFVPLAVGLSTLMVAAGLSIARTGVVPRWLGWIAIVLGILALTPAGFVAFMGGAIWIVVVGVLLAMRARAVPPDRPATTSA